MNAILSGILMLLPALLALIVLVGVPIALGMWLVPYLRDHLPGKHPVVAQALHTPDRRSGHEKRRRAMGRKSGYRPISA